LKIWFDSCGDIHPAYHPDAGRVFQNIQASVSLVQAKEIFQRHAEQVAEDDPVDPGMADD
jgi:hypothetical protein